MNFKIFVISAFLLHVSLTGCMEWDYGGENDIVEIPEHGLFIVNEGNFQYGNATLSFYSPSNESVENELFVRANGMKLGDVGQSMTIHNGLGWIVVNNSHVVFAIDPTTAKERGRITNFTSPRYIHFVDDRKAYVTQLWDNRIFIVDPKTYSITGYITVPGMEAGTGSTEQMVQIGRYVYCNCWSYQNSIIRIDTETDEVTARLEVGIQPRALAADKNGRLWTLTDGGTEGSPYGYEAPMLVRIDPADFTVEKKFILPAGKRATTLTTDGDGSTLYWIADEVWRMPVYANVLPAMPFLTADKMLYYTLTVDPDRGDVYVADAIDYQQPGMIYRYSSNGELIDKFSAGITPGTFCWK